MWNFTQRNNVLHKQTITFYDQFSFRGVWNCNQVVDCCFLDGKAKDDSQIPNGANFVYSFSVRTVFLEVIPRIVFTYFEEKMDLKKLIPNFIFIAAQTMVVSIVFFLSLKEFKETFSIFIHVVILKCRRKEYLKTSCSVTFVPRVNDNTKILFSKPSFWHFAGPTKTFQP